MFELTVLEVLCSLIDITVELYYYLLLCNQLLIEFERKRFSFVSFLTFMLYLLVYQEIEMDPFVRIALFDWI